MIVVAHQTFQAIGVAALAQPAPTTQDAFRVVMWIGLAIALLILAGVAIMIYRKRMFGADSDVDVAGSLFDELRKAQRDGLLSQSEYDLARKKLAAKASEAMDRRTAQRKAENHDTEQRQKRRREWN